VKNNQSGAGLHQFLSMLSRVRDVAAIVHPHMCDGGYISSKYGETRSSLSLSSEKWCGSRHLVFWSLGTLTGLRDQARGLVA
jgi:hypothetical protein